MKKLSEKEIEKIENEVIILLLNCIEEENDKNENVNFNVNNAYYAEAFGMMRTLVALNYGSFGANNFPENISNVQYWFSELKTKTLDLKNEHGIQEALRIYNDKFNKKK